MQLKIYCILDTKLGAYLPPEFFHNDAQAIRIFGDAVVNSKGNFGKHPEDFHFYRVGEFDDQSGKFKVHEPEFLAKALDFNVENPVAKENASLKDQLVKASVRVQELEEKVKELEQLMQD